MIELKGVTKRFKTVTAVDSVDLTIKKGNSLVCSVPTVQEKLL